MKTTILINHWLPEGEPARWRREFPECVFLDGQKPEGEDCPLAMADLAFGLPDLARLKEAKNLRWIQLASAGVPWPLCAAALERGIQVTNLAGLYGPTIAEHALGMMLVLCRNLHLAQRNQQIRTWDREVMRGVRDLHGQTLAIVGLGNIGQHVARLARAFGMRVLGCRREPRPSPDVDLVVGPDQVRTILADAEVVVVAAPLTPASDGLLGPAEFQAMKAGALYINVSRGGVAQESALVDALRTGHLAGAGLDVFAVEPLPRDHPLWSLPNVLISPHYSGETVNWSHLPARRFIRNLRNWQDGHPLEGLVKLDLGY